MDPIREDLDRMASENQVDFTFDYEPVYKGTVKRGNPDEILFKIKLSELGEEIYRKRKQQKLPSDIWDMLRSEYKLTESDVRMLSEMLPDELMKSFRSEVLALRDRMGKYKINNPKSYVVTSLKNFIFQHTPEVEEEKDACKVVGNGDVSSSRPVSEEDKGRWQAFMELLQGSVPFSEFNTWLSSLEFVSFESHKVKVSVPASYVATYIEERLIIPFKEALSSVYGEDVELFYEVRK